MPDTVQIKIGYIGGGSRAWALMLMNDLAQYPHLGGEVLLYDIDAESARRNQRLGNWMQDQPGVVSRWHYRAVDTLADALQGVDFVVVSIQPGPLSMMGHELAVAETYGLHFPVGDTTGAPGLMRGLRSAIIYAEFAHAIATHCPNAWVINYTNPMSICTRTLTAVEPGLKVFGCCHEVFGTQALLAAIARRYLELDHTPARSEIDVNVLGINHFTWIDRASYHGHDLLALLRRHIEQPGVLRSYSRAEVEAKNNWFTDEHQIKFELFRRFGILAAAGDRHLAEFLPGFIRSDEELFRWGLIRTPISYRYGRYEEAPGQIEQIINGNTPFQLRNSGEEAVRQIAALVGQGDLVTNVNMENTGQIANLPIGAVVETNAYFGTNRVQPLSAGMLPPGVHALVMRHIANQEMIIEAALHRDAELAFQAVYNDPTTDLPIDQAYAMFMAIGLPADFW
ncbi:MAG TPA: alpha-glucosidase/alpha-galactosidase [Roseiflexaceae bacterium]|nr:alpha-glucosidase/alpha-galactosidase [Roseiflexaceae bacterium]HMP43037.1 alpha-glucosidase/alpha-galactosidase [Roseiflexaceae bacterium]